MKILAGMISLSLVSAFVDGGATFQKFIKQTELVDNELSQKTKEAKEDTKKKAEQAMAKAEAIVASLRKDVRKEGR